MVRTFLASISVFLASGLSYGQEKQSVVKFEQTVTEPLRLEYLLSLPEGYKPKDASKKWPLVIFLHGAGERGDDVQKVAIHGPPKLVKAGKKFPFILVSPQCPKDSWWTQEPILELLDDLEKRYSVDPERVYLTGLSMGGYGTWHFAALAPDRFAAAVPICGGGVPYLTRTMAKTPVWVFHGAKDPVVPLDESTRLVKVLQKQGNKDVTLTVYPDAGHDSWTEAYNTAGLYDWLLQQRRPK